MSDFYVFLRELWVLWFVALFSFVVVWAFWPGRRRTLEAYGDIPLRDDEPSPTAKTR